MRILFITEYKKIKLDTQEWKHISSTGKDLVLKMLSPNPINRPTISEILEHPWMRDRDKLQRAHLGDTVEELKRYNARRKLKGAVQAVAGGVALDPLCCADTDSMAIGTASESLNEWADEEAGLEAIQKVLDSLDDIIALQDANCDPEVLASMLRDVKLHELLQLYDRISSSVINPLRAPPGDAISRCRDVVDAISSAPGHKQAREKAELINLLGSSHIQIYILYMQITRIGIWKVLALPSFGDPFLRWLAEREDYVAEKRLSQAELSLKHCVVVQTGSQWRGTIMRLNDEIDVRVDRGRANGELEA
ncbi:calcium-dependent protein kinase [Culex quinquefasciatus]|uniref:Calcium-dependent protein kinase n=1 Tax=Culex quinquefasciatus TaxID=7176 RepID=B0WA47_CULQU|nr:calcium-dependent protein kinase [Culex quinquefasciatus]|eukprot:XP_001845581.1 calcium-dependent protein kinase [Culex quinquefasciatus]